MHLSWGRSVTIDVAPGSLWDRNRAPGEPGVERLFLDVRTRRRHAQRHARHPARLHPLLLSLTAGKRARLTREGHDDLLVVEQRKWGVGNGRTAVTRLALGMESASDVKREVAHEGARRAPPCLRRFRRHGLGVTGVRPLIVG